MGWCIGMIGHLNGLRFWRVLLLVAGVVLSFGAGAQAVSVEMVVSLKDAKALTIRSAPNAEGTVVAFVENGKVVVKKIVLSCFYASIGI